MTTTLAPRLTISEVVRVYEAACAEIRESFARLSAAQQRLNETFTMDHWAGIRVAESIDRTSYDDPERTLLRIRHEVWSSIIQRLEVKRMMSMSARAKVVSVPGVCGGEPIIDGTRITVSNVLRVLMCSDGATIVRDAYPHLTDEQVMAALKCAEWKV